MNRQNNQDDQNYLKALSVLYVEDEVDIREELATFLRRRVACVYTAENGQEGLDAFSQYQPDLVITDIRMPVMDGLDMVERIRAMSPKTPIILTTAFEESRYFQKAIDLGVDKYVTKPLNLDILASALLKCVRAIRSEAALREVEERYRLLFQLSHFAISLSDTDGISGNEPGALIMDGRIMDCNAAFLALLGYERHDDFSMMLFSDLLTPDVMHLVNQLTRDELLVRGFTRECELELRHKEGRTVPVIAQFILRRDAEGQAKEAWAVMRDISEQRRSEKALRLAERVFENSSEAILVTDQDNHILSANRACSRITGYSQEEVIGQNSGLFKSDQHDQAFYQQMWERLLTNGCWQGELWNRRKMARFTLNGCRLPWLAIATGALPITSPFFPIYRSSKQRHNILSSSPITIR